jgi:NAD+ synthase
MRSNGLSCVEMPIHQHACHVNRAKEHIAQLKNRFKRAVCLTTLLKHSNQQYQQIFQKTN